MPTVGPQELLVIGVVIAVIFGASKLPKIGKGLGEGIRNFKDAIKEIGSGLDDDDDNL